MRRSRSNEEEQDMRVVVVGSGIAGAAAGYELARAGVDVVLVDSLPPGRATSAGAGIICPWSSQVDDPDLVPDRGRRSGALPKAAGGVDR
ncbi:FAD-dependent oxidoreductase [Streptomyces sp. NPDC058424]|uniref:FAD-dependent oxidoreductase n=1 Tax=Streptomyces sp. NPDC058424 TaxID=3346491 RepID=UPI00364CFB61